MRNLGKKGIGDGGPTPGLKKAPKDLEAKKPIALRQENQDLLPDHVQDKGYGVPALPRAETLGVVLGEYTGVMEGPLRMGLAETFSGGSYKVVKLERDMSFFRAGDANVPLGEFFTRDDPISIILARIERGIMGKWPRGGESIINASIEVKIPAGTIVYVGRTGFQKGIFLGGVEQIVIPTPWELDNVVVLNIKRIF